MLIAARLREVYRRAASRVRELEPRVSIDRELLHDAGVIVPEDPVTGLLEEFRIVKRELLPSPLRKPEHSFLPTCPMKSVPR